MKLVAEEEKKRAEAVRDAAVFAARQADLDANNARKAEKEAERKLREGIQPMVMPTPEDLSEAKRIVNYTEGLFHFAIAGSAGAGKSSLINSFRGLRNLQGGAAATGVVETTLQTGRFPDPNPQNPFVWYDIPGAGTLKIPDWQYFNSQGLYVFDCIVVLFDNRFTMTDIAILANCARFDIPTYIVRSKSDVQIRNIMKEMGYDSEEEDRKQRNKLYKLAREQYITETRASVKQNLENANLPEKKVYLVTNDVLLTIVKNNTIPPKMIDELDLMMDLFGEAHTRRCRKSTMSRR
ncbi:P-loop containing nucleoside triphosphate hydrolase protein [Hygrophoropsis aurantiaca]|uniref:P-loop containing nucleoside triphosphate hydrolase protein n=1 Tax=Hygrophoropsis aurantiaca TaxID=72124 RepID=A0ACB8A4V6_9AGAM|nr:P-loop containing nucleoside triphosphate hydrolase protein [Hygrophoropsis aurantiaca]